LGPLGRERGLVVFLGGFFSSGCRGFRVAAVRRGELSGGGGVAFSRLAVSVVVIPGDSPALASVTSLLRGTSGVQPRDSEQ
jgi:hypothetical protein